jgi:hypothetical protein
MTATTLKHLSLGGRRQKKQQQNKRGGRQTKKRQQKRQRHQRGGVDPLQKVVNMMKEGGGNGRLATNALTKAVGGNADVMSK